MKAIHRDREQDGAKTTDRQQSRSQGDNTADPDRLLTILQDDDCRELLAATARESLTATELARACDIPSSTVYRKIDQLLDQDLLEESMRIRTNGYHTKEYRLAVKEIRVSLVDRGGLEFDVSTDNKKERCD